MTSTTAALPADALDFPCLPVVCLETGNMDLTTHDVVKKVKNYTVIDFWTCRCTRCPAALDKLDSIASDPKYADKGVQFVSICCDKLDGAREIIDRDDERKWQNIHHYFMAHNDKETAKEALGFKAVPFYVIVNPQGDIAYAGGKLSDELDKLVLSPDKVPVDHEPTPATTAMPEKKAAGQQGDFVVEDLDF